MRQSAVCRVRILVRADHLWRRAHALVSVDGRGFAVPADVVRQFCSPAFRPALTNGLWCSCRVAAAHVSTLAAAKGWSVVQAQPHYRPAELTRAGTAKPRPHARPLRPRPTPKRAA